MLCRRPFNRFKGWTEGEAWVWISAGNGSFSFYWAMTWPGCHAILLIKGKNKKYSSNWMVFNKRRSARCQLGHLSGSTCPPRTGVQSICQTQFSPDILPRVSLCRCTANISQSQDAASIKCVTIWQMKPAFIANWNVSFKYPYIPFHTLHVLPKRLKTYRFMRRDVYQNQVLNGPRG